MKRKLILRWLALALCIACVGPALAEEDVEVSIGEFLSTAETALTEQGNADGGLPGGVVRDKTEPVFEWDGSIVVTLSFVGDMTIGGNMQAKGKSIFERELEKQKGDIHFPFRNVREIFLADDLTVVNFEGTLTTAGRNPGKMNNDFLFRAPPEYVEMLAPGGVDAVALENNHVLDMGEEGLSETKQTLTRAGVAYASEDEPVILVTRGVTIGLLAYQTFGGRHDELVTKVPQDIAALRAGGCEIVVVNYHWGSELDYKPNENQVRLGRATIDGGADLVIGHHSHRINPIELYNGKYICYSLGNFSFAGNNKPNDMSTFLFQIKMRVKDGVASNEAIKLIPARISSRSDYNDFAPTPYDKPQSVESVISVLKKNGAGLEYALADYPTKWPGEE